jgi:hypothetical protein
MTAPQLVEISEVYSGVDRSSEPARGIEPTLVGVLGTKSNVGHRHNISEIEALLLALDQKANTADLQTALDAISTLSAGTDVKLLSARLDTKADVASVVELFELIRAKADDVIIGGIVTELATRASAADVLAIDARLGEKADTSMVVGIATALNTKADGVHGHQILEISGLEDDLGTRAMSLHTHTLASITGLQAELDTRFPLTGGTLSGELSAPSVVADTFTSNGGRELCTKNYGLRLAASHTGRPLSCKIIATRGEEPDAFLMWDEPAKAWVTNNGSKTVPLVAKLADLGDVVLGVPALWDTIAWNGQNWVAAPVHINPRPSSWTKTWGALTDLAPLPVGHAMALPVEEQIHHPTQIPDYLYKLELDSNSRVMVTENGNYSVNVRGRIKITYQNADQLPVGFIRVYATQAATAESSAGQLLGHLDLVDHFTPEDRALGMSGGDATSSWIDFNAVWEAALEVTGVEFKISNRLKTGVVELQNVFVRFTLLSFAD